MSDLGKRSSSDHHHIIISGSILDKKHMTACCFNSLDLFLIKISSSGGGEPCDPFNGSSWWEETGVHFWLLLQVFDHHNIIRWKIGQQTMEMIKINVYCTLCRQYWTDQRLSFNSNVIDELTMNWQVESKTSQSVLLVAVYIQQLVFLSLHCMLNIWKPLCIILQFLYKIWTPDTYFLNGRDSYLHKIAVPNRWEFNNKLPNVWLILWVVSDLNLNHKEEETN